MVEYPVKNVKLYNNGDKNGTLSPVDFYYITQHHNRESLKTLRNPIIKRWNKKGYLIHRKSYKYQNYLPLWIYISHLLERQEHNYRDIFPHTETKWYKYQIADKKIKYKDTFSVNLWDIIIYEHFSLQEFIHTGVWKKEGETSSVSYMDLRDKIKTRISVSIVESGHSYNVESNVWSKAYIGLKNLDIEEKEIWNTYSGGDKAFESQIFTWEFKYKESENTDTCIYWKSDNWYKLITKEQEYILLKIEQENKLPLQRWVKREIASQQPWYSEIIVVSDPIGWVKYVIVDKVDNYNDIVPTTEWIKEMILYEWAWYQNWITPSTPAPNQWQDEYEYTERILMGFQMKKVCEPVLIHKGNAVVHINITWRQTPTFRTMWIIYYDDQGGAYETGWRSAKEDIDITFTGDIYQLVIWGAQGSATGQIITNIKITVTQT